MIVNFGINTTNKNLRVEFIKFIDKYIGLPICIALSCCKKIEQLNLFKDKHNKQSKKILIIKFWGIGNIILLLPTIKAIRDKFPEAQITFLTLSENEGIIENTIAIDNLIYLKLNNLPLFLLDSLRLILRLRLFKFDVVLDFEEFARFSTILTYLSGAQNRIGFITKRQYRGDLYTNKVIFNEHQHITENFANLVKSLDIYRNGYDLLKIAFSNKDEKYVNLLLDGKVFGNSWIVGMHIGTGPNAILRQWPKERFANLADKLINDLNATAIFIGKETNEQLVKSAIDLMKSKPINLIGKTNIKQLACLIERCDLFISNDSGPAHLAEAMQTPSITLFGPESPDKYGPKNKQYKVIYKRLPCSPCLSVENTKTTRCRQAKCLEAITTEEVFEEVVKFRNEKFDYFEEHSFVEL